MSIPNYGSIGDANAEVNAKAFGDAGSHLAIQSAQNYASHANRINVMSESVLGALTLNLISPDPVEAAATQKILTGRDSLDVAGVLTLVSQLVKTSQSTPPVTP